MPFKETQLKYKLHGESESKSMLKALYQANINQRKRRVTKLLLGNVGFGEKKMMRNIEQHYIMIIESVP